MDPVVVIVVVFLAILATWVVRGYSDEYRARRARLDRLLNGYDVDTSVDEARAEVRTRAVIEEANLTWSRERRPVVVNLSAWRQRRRQGSTAS